MFGTLWFPIYDVPTDLEAIVAGQYVACENVRFSSLFTAGDISHGGTSATQRQKFHTDYANQCFRNKSGSLGFQIWICTILLIFWSILHGKVLCSFAHELQQNSSASCREHYIPNVDCFVRDSSRLHLTFVAFCLLSTPSTNQLLPPDSGQILRHQYGISVAETQTFLLAKRPQWRRARRNGCFRRLEKWLQ